MQNKTLAVGIVVALLALAAGAYAMNALHPIVAGQQQGSTYTPVLPLKQ